MEKLIGRRKMRGDIQDNQNDLLFLYFGNYGKINFLGRNGYIAHYFHTPFLPLEIVINEKF